MNSRGLRRSSSFSGHQVIGSLLHGPQRVPNPVVGASGGATSLKRHSSHSALNTLSSAKQRRSSHGVGSAAACVKDTRPFSEKPFRELMVKKLVEFLTTHHYPFPINLKGSNGPSRADFRKIFEFLVSHLRRGFKLGDKLEEEVPRLLKEHGYPFTISKSHLSTIGVQHTWPPLLAALSHLRVCIEASETVDMERILFFCPSDGKSVETDDQIIHRFLELSYSNFLAENDAECERLVKEFEKKFDSCKVTSGHIELVEEEVKRLEATLAVLESKPNELLKLQNENNTLSIDIEKMDRYVTSLTSHQQDLENTLARKQAEQLDLAAKRGALVAEIQRKNKIVSTQAISGVDAQRMNSKRTELKTKLGQAEKELSDLDRDLLAERELYNTEAALVEAEVEAYNKKVRLVQLIAKAAGNGIDFEMKPTLSMTESDRVENSVKPGLYHLNQRQTEKCRHLEYDLQKSKEALEQLCENFAERQEQYTTMTNSIASTDAKMDRIKEMHMAEIKSLQTQLDELNAAIVTRRDQSAFANAMRLLHAEQESCEQERIKLQKRENEYCEHLIQMSKLVVEYKNNMKANLPLKIAEAKAKAFGTDSSEMEDSQ